MFNTLLLYDLNKKTLLKPNNKHTHIAFTVQSIPIATATYARSTLPNSPRTVYKNQLQF